MRKSTFWTLTVAFGALLAIVLFVTLRSSEPEAREMFVPLMRANATSLPIAPRAYVAVFVSEEGKETVLAEKDAGTPFPIASVTKLMTALVASERHTADDTITISQAALRTKGASGAHPAGTVLPFSSALDALLIASHNEVGTAFSEATPGFIDAMNAKAKALELVDTGFVNASGVDPSPSDPVINHSTAHDLYVLARHINEYVPHILAVSRKEGAVIVNDNGEVLVSVKSTNALLGRSDLPFSIIGGKTGETPRAKQNLVLVTDAPCNGTLYSAVVGSDDRFGDMLKLVNYVRDSYDWTCPKEKAEAGVTAIRVAHFV